MSITSREYVNIHLWIKKNYGKAIYCSNIKCLNKSKRYEWAKLEDREYEKNINNFRKKFAKNIKIFLKIYFRIKFFKN